MHVNTEYSLESSWRDLQDLHSFVPFRPQQFSRVSIWIKKEKGKKKRKKNFFSFRYECWYFFANVQTTSSSICNCRTDLCWNLIDSRSPRKTWGIKKKMERSKKKQQGHIWRNLHSKKKEMWTKEGKVKVEHYLRERAALGGRAVAWGSARTLDWFSITKTKFCRNFTDCPENFCTYRKSEENLWMF